jgi:hypothetical protein
MFLVHSFLINQGLFFSNAYFPCLLSKANR